MKKFNEFKLESEELKKVGGGRRVYNGTSVDCNTGRTESVWDVYGVFGNYKGREVVIDHV